MPRPTNATILQRLKAAEELLALQTKAIADIHALADRSHERIDKAGRCFLAMRDDYGGQLADLAERLSYGSMAGSQA